MQCVRQLAVYCLPKTSALPRLGKAPLKRRRCAKSYSDDALCMQSGPTHASIKITISMYLTCNKRCENKQNQGGQLGCGGGGRREPTCFYSVRKTLLIDFDEYLIAGTSDGLLPRERLLRPEMKLAPFLPALRRLMFTPHMLQQQTPAIKEAIAFREI